MFEFLSTWPRDCHEIFKWAPDTMMGCGTFLASGWVILKEKGRKVYTHSRWSVTDGIISLSCLGQGVCIFLLPPPTSPRSLASLPVLGWSAWLFLTNGIWAKESHTLSEKQLQIWLLLILGLCCENEHPPWRGLAFTRGPWTKGHAEQS